MATVRARVSALTWILMVYCSCAWALGASLDISQYAHTSWSFRTGFLDGAVYTIAQSPDGYLWLGTQTGVFRFDGVRAAPLPLPPGQILANTEVGALLPARDGTLWIGTLDELVSWKNGELIKHPTLSRGRVNALLQGRDGTIWVGTVAEAPGRLCAIRGDSTQCYGADGSLGTSVESLYEDQEGSLWVGTTNGLWRWNPGASVHYLTAPILERQALAPGDNESSLIIAMDSVRQLIGKNLTDYPLPGLPSSFGAVRVLRDRIGGLWIGTESRGLVHAYEGRTSTFTHRDGLSSDRVKALFEDREGTIWVGTSAGLDRFREQAVTSLSVGEGLSSPFVTSVLAARDGSLWIGTSDGLDRLKDGHVTVYRRRNDPGLLDDEIQSIFEDERGRIWASGYRGLAVLENEKFAAVPSAPVGGKFAIAGDGQGGLWLSLWFAPNEDYGLVHLVDGKVTEHVPWQKLGGSPGLGGLLPDPKGGVWVGLRGGGISYFYQGQSRNLPLNDAKDSATRVLDLSPEPDGSFWIATDNGLSRLYHGHVTTLTTANGLPCNEVHWIIADDSSSYWLYTRCGLLRVARNELEGWVADPQRKIRVTIFDAADGVRLVPTLSGFRPQVTKSADGKVWFVNYDTLSFFDPSRIKMNTLAPPVHIEQLMADRKGYGVKPGLRLPPLVRDISIDYAALSLVAPEKIHFRYRLDGQDPDWKEVINDRVAHYSNLPPGDYRFRVTASNNSGVWNETGAFLDFSIAPAYYQSTWFRASCVAVFLGLLWAPYQLHMRQVAREKNYHHEAQMTLAHANRLAAMGQLSASIAHEVNQPIAGTVTNAQAARRFLKMNPPDLEEVDQALAGIVRDGNRAAEVVDRVRTMIKKAPPKKEDVALNDAIVEVVAMTRAEANKHGISVRTELAQDLPTIHGDRVQLQQVMVNLVLNATEAMSGTGDGGGEMLIRSQAGDAGNVLVSVADSGPGLAPAALAKLFEAFYTTKPNGMGLGLSICRSIVESHGGQLSARARVPRGTVFQFTLPVEPPS